MKGDYPEELECPISHSLMIDPVTTIDGYTYDRESIENWFKTSDISPGSRLPIHSRILITNYIVRSLVDKYLTPDQIEMRTRRNRVHKINLKTLDLAEPRRYYIKYPNEYKKLVRTYDYNIKLLRVPLSHEELEDLLSHFGSFEKLRTQAKVSWLDFSLLSLGMREMFLKHLDAVAKLVIDVKIKWSDIPRILCNKQKKPGDSLFYEADDIVKLVQSGLDWPVFYNLDELTKDKILFHADLMCEALVQNNMPLDRFLRLPPKKMCAFADAISGINSLVVYSKVLWDTILSIDEKYYPRIRDCSVQICNLLQLPSVTLELLLSQPNDTFKFLITERGNISGLFRDKVISSIEELINYIPADREFLVKNEVRVSTLVCDYGFKVSDILSLNEKERDYLICNCSVLYRIFYLRNKNKNPDGQAINLPKEGDNYARWAVDTLKQCQQVDGTFQGLEGVKTHYSPLNLNVVESNKTYSLRPLIERPNKIEEKLPYGYRPRPRYKYQEPDFFTPTQRGLLGAGFAMAGIGGGLWIAFATGALSLETAGASALIATLLSIAWPAASILTVVGAILVVGTGLYASFDPEQCAWRELRRQQGSTFN